MSEPPSSGESRDSESEFAFGDRFERIGRSLGERENVHAADIARARSHIEGLRRAVASALDDFSGAARAAGAPHLEVELSEIRTDDKHLRALEFELVRGRHCAIVTAKSRGEVTLVGPFQRGKTEGPCRSFPFDAGPELRDAIGDFLEKFLDAAATP